MRKLFKILSLAVVGMLGAESASWATVVTLTPPGISPNTNTTSFSDGSVTLQPTIGGQVNVDTATGIGTASPVGGTVIAVTFNSNLTRLGIDNSPVGTAPNVGSTATNANAFNDRDTTVSNGNEEGMRFTFAPLTGLQSISYDFARADALAIVNDAANTSDGVFISGFLFDPGVTFTVVSGAAPTALNAPQAFWNGSTNTVRLDIKGGGFSGALIRVNFADPNASLGQVLNLRVTDSDQAGAQLPIREIQHVSIPEPAAFLFGGLATVLAGVGFCARRRSA